MNQLGGIPDGGQEPLLQLTALTKDYPGLRALDNVDFDLLAGECHIIFGENGAGKSTLISMIAGVQTPTSGEIIHRGEKVHLDSVQKARRIGISAVFQEFSLVPQLSVADNIFLGAEVSHHGVLQKKRQDKEALALISRLGFALNVSAPVNSLTRAEQQMVEIAKAFRKPPSVLVLDEPTASLTNQEVDKLFELLANLKSEGVGIIYITHRMNELKRIGERITVLRDGRHAGTADVQTISEDDIIMMMSGRTIAEVFPSVHCAPGEVVLAIDALATSSGVRDVSLQIHRGEIVGLAGLVGSGKSEIARACYGLEKITAGTVRLNGEDVTGLSCAEMLAKGMFYLPPDRRKEGLAMMRSCRENIALPALREDKFMRFGVLDRRAEKKQIGSLAQKFQLVPLKIEQEAEFFSGGNQQKIMLAKALVRQASVFIFDEPTVGVDVGTRTEIYNFIKELCENGAAVLLISSDLPEVINMAHRIVVFNRGETRALLLGDEITEEKVLANFFERPPLER